MTKLIPIALAVLTACSSYTLKHSNRMGVATAVMTIACDYGSTSWAMDNGYMETNPILGPAPSDGRLALYMGTAALATAGLWLIAPEYLRPVVWGVTAVQVKAVASNTALGVPLCGIDGTH